MKDEASRNYQPGPAGAAEARQDGDAWTLVFPREFAHPRRRVWAALTDRALLRKWAPFDPDRDLDTPGPVVLRMAGDAGAETLPCNVTRVEPPALLEYTWGSDVLRWELEEIQTGTRLTLHHTVQAKDWLPRVAAGWHICFDVMDQELAGMPLGRIVAGDAMNFGWERLHGEYAMLFRDR